MECKDETIIKLRQEINFYKKQLNELTGDVIGHDYKIIEMSNEIRQMQKGFAMIAGLNQFKPIPVFEEIYDHFTEEINIQMQMDLSLILQPVDKMKDYFVPTFIKGSSDCSISMIGLKKILISTSFVQEKKSLLVNSQTIINPFIKLLQERFGIKYFILTPVVVQKNLIAYLFTGRKTEKVVLATSRLLLHDVHALEAIAGVIAAIKNQHDQFHLLQKERTRISGEMHDDIGSEVTKIKLFSQALTLKLKDGSEEKKKLQSISEAASKMVQTINEIIWTMNSRNDTLSNLAAYIRRHTSDYLELYNIKYTLDFPADIPPVFINNNSRRNIFLIVKEALHNIIKHAAANTVFVKLTYEAQYLKIEIRDNGNGFAVENNHGNGLLNMNLRMKDCGGNFNVSSTPGKGTEITLMMPLPDERVLPDPAIGNTTFM